MSPRGRCRIRRTVLASRSTAFPPRRKSARSGRPRSGNSPRSGHCSRSRRARRRTYSGRPRRSRPARSGCLDSIGARVRCRLDCRPVHTVRSDRRSRSCPSGGSRPGPHRSVSRLRGGSTADPVRRTRRSGRCRREANESRTSDSACSRCRKCRSRVAACLDRSRRSGSTRGSPAASPTCSSGRRFRRSDE